MIKGSVLIYVGMIFLTGCAAFGVPYTSDPYTKVDYSYTLLSQGRALPAEKLTNEALQEFIKTGDTRGEAEAHVFFGQFYKSPTYRSYAPFYKKQGEYDPSNDKAISHSLLAVELYEGINNYMQAAKAKFSLATAYLDVDQVKACNSFDETLVSYKKGETENPTETFQYNNYYGSFEGLIDAFKRKFCTPLALASALKSKEEKVAFDLSNYNWKKEVSVELSLANNLNIQDCKIDQLLNDTFNKGAADNSVNVVEGNDTVPHLEVVVKKVKEGVFATAKAKTWVTAKLILDNKLIGNFDSAENIDFYEGYNFGCKRIEISLTKTIAPIFKWLENPTSEPK